MNASSLLKLCCGLALFFVFSHEAAWTQILDRIAQFREQERRAVAEPFKGVTTDGVIVPGLFKLSPTGVSTRPVREAAQAFLEGLSAEQRSKTLFPVADDEWRKWDNRSFPPRQGVGFNEMTERQRELAFVMQDEQNKGLRFFNALDSSQQIKALIRGDKGPEDSLAQAYKDNLVLDYAGLPASQLNEKQKAQLLDLISEYVSNITRACRTA